MTKKKYTGTAGQERALMRERFSKALNRMLIDDVAQMPEAHLVTAIISNAAVTAERNDYWLFDDNSDFPAYCNLLGLQKHQVRSMAKSVIERMEGFA